MNANELDRFADALNQSVAVIAAEHDASADNTLLAVLNTVYLITRQFYDAQDGAAMLRQAARLLDAMADSTAEKRVLH